MKYNLVTVGDEKNLTLVVNGEMYVASHSHPNWDAIIAGVLKDDESVVDLFDVAETVSRRFEALTERVTVRNGVVYFDGDELDRAETRQIVRFLNDGEDDFMPLVNFLEKVQTNPNEHSREQLYTWLDKHDFPITDDGDIVAYKGVRVLDNGNYVSISSGKAIVDGEEVSGNIPNAVGSVIEMPRSEVHHDPATGCSRGLHAGTWDYASNFAQGAVLTVRINPRDVVSVPTDCDWQKVRVCRYVVTGVTETQYDGAHWVDEDDFEDDYEEDYSWGELEDDFEPAPTDTRFNYLGQHRDEKGRFVKSV